MDRTGSKLFLWMGVMPKLSMAAVLLAFILNENLKPDSTAQRLFVRVLPLVVAVGVVYSCLLCLVDEAGWWSQAYPWAYQALLEVFQFWT